VRERTIEACGCVYFDGKIYSECPELAAILKRVIAADEMRKRAGKSVRKAVIAVNLLDTARAQVDEHTAKA
jgi:hypothetical protein